jgi:hypothetical protein
VDDLDDRVRLAMKNEEEKGFDTKGSAPGQIAYHLMMNSDELKHEDFLEVASAVHIVRNKL